MEDRRIFARISAKVPLRLQEAVGGAESRAESLDISADGLGVMAYENLACNTHLEIWLDIPDHHQPLHLEGEVVWCNRVSDSGDEYRIGIQLQHQELFSLSRLFSQR